MGAYISIENNTPDEWHCKVGPDKKALKVGSIIVGAIAAAGAILATRGIVVGAGDNVVAAVVGDAISARDVAAIGARDVEAILVQVLALEATRLA